MINIAICEDELKQRLYIKSIIENEIKKRNLCKNITEYESGEDLIEKIKKNKYEFDIIFLDIKMKKLSGIHTAKIIRTKDSKVIIIFITGLDEYVFEGYDVRAFNYLLKPIDEKKIIKVFNKALGALNENEKAYVINFSNQIYSIKYKEIEYFGSDKRVINIYCKDESYKFYGNLNEVENNLSGMNFIRCHRRYIVNLENVKKINNNKIITYCGNEIPISRSRYKDTIFAFAKNIVK